MFKLLPFLLIACVSFGQSVDPKHELLWEISGSNLASPSYLFGSFHSNDKRLFNLSDSTFYALSKAETIVLETDIFSLSDTWDTRIASVNIKYDNEGVPYVSDSNPSTTHYGDEDGMPQFLDAFFQQYCYNAGKEFVALESIDFQLNLLSDVSFSDLSNFRLESLLLDTEDILEMYLTGDIHELDKLLRLSLSIYPSGYEELITDRNVGMAEGIDSLVQSGETVFCAVGAGHLAGNGGLISLLRRKGYTLRKVIASYSEKPTEERKEIFSKRFYEYENDTLDLHVRFPGKPLVVEKGEFDDFELKLAFRDFGQGNSYEVIVYPILDDVDLEKLAESYIASPAESPMKRINLDSGGTAYQGLADSYPEGLYWARVIRNEQSLIVIKAYGGNKFMNSNRAQRFFEQVWLD